METWTCSNCGRGGIGIDTPDCPFCDGGDGDCNEDNIEYLNAVDVNIERHFEKNKVREKRNFSNDDKRVQKKRQKNPNQKKFKKHYHLNF